MALAAQAERGLATFLQDGPRSPKPPLGVLAKPSQAEQG